MADAPSTTCMRPAAQRIATDMRVLSARVTFRPELFRVPLKLSSGDITDITLASAAVDVERTDGARACGRGMIYLSDLWAWPDQQVLHNRRSAIMEALTRRIAIQLPAMLEGWGHPMEFGCTLHHAARQAAGALAADEAWSETIPVLAVSVCASIFDAALHDAYGVLHGRSSYDLIGPEALPGDLSRFLPRIDTGVTLEAALDFRFSPAIAGCFIVGMGDPLYRSDIEHAINDGLPECAEEWVERHGFQSVKIKVHGKDPREDAALISRVTRMLDATHGRLETGANPWVTVDPNEAYASVEGVLELLHALRDCDARAYRALRYLEQPVPRKEFTGDLRPVHRLKPVLADESITGTDCLEALVAAGWSGLALKVCKGHSLSLLLIAWSQLHGLPYTLQDLTNPSFAAIHALGLAARVRTLNGVELNAMQYTPGANRDAALLHPGAFAPVGGLHDASTVIGPGLGYGGEGDCDRTE